MPKSKYLPDGFIEEMIRPIAEGIAEDIKSFSQSAAEEFYSHQARSGDGHWATPLYHRTGSFLGLGQKSKITPIENGLEVRIEYNADEVTVNPWIYGPGSAGWAFDADYLHGFHGGPHPIGNGVWSWGDVLQTEAPWDQISNYVLSKYEK